MTYEDLDPQLMPWSKSRGLHVFTKHRDYDVRTIHVVDDSGDIYEMSVTPQNTNDPEILIGLWDKKKRTESIKIGLEDLTDGLEIAYEKIESWIKERGHSRTIYK
ncbi:hypothetical protein IEN85_10780 [Pelagicoccus sp. NFK12]|uniref:Uncharacterized protein n=1 Tax=Pelagicoccus enzymogenes TaxID=2773457 RepID=A0A927FAP5_9BACT|nr:hypothetical protein [Pelagicoccus enzymogenes]MBD5779973.1 hypothetical protein [Pelagicoccus enzymogenes]